MAKLTVEQALFKADSDAGSGRVDEARSLYQAVLKAAPHNERAKQALTDLDATGPRDQNTPPQDVIDEVSRLFGSGQFKPVAERLPSLLDAYPHSLVLWNIEGAISAAFEKWTRAEVAFRRVVEIKPGHAAGYSNLGAALQKQGKLQAAIKAYRHALELRPDFAEAHNNLGVTLEEYGQPTQAIESYTEALKLDPHDAETHTNLASLLRKQGQLERSIASYTEALRLTPDDAEIHNNLGVTFENNGQFDHALRSYFQALKLKPDFAEAHNNLGIVFGKKGQPQRAITHYSRALALKPDFAHAYNNMGNALQEQGQLPQAIKSYERALELEPEFRGAQVQMLHQRRQICDWAAFSSTRNLCATFGIAGRSVPPFAMLSMEDNAHRQMLRSQSWSDDHVKRAPFPLPATPPNRPEKLRVGYFSGKFHNHPGLYLMAGLPREHDKTQFEVYAYSYGRIQTSELRDRLISDVDVFTDIHRMSDKQAVELARQHQLDFAVDLRGYTKDTRTELFAYRLAPIQINFLGYPSTTGADFIDYIIADPTTVPSDQRNNYTESVIYLPFSYQPNDDQRPIAALDTNRGDFNLPGDVFVFCCFNTNYKISPLEFDVWMRIMKQVKGSVLWLLRSNKWSVENLRREAAIRGVDPDRLIFADKLPNSEHLARHKHADLFLDTFNYNAHTTASDALWAGLPVVTKCGEQFAARVAASLLKAVGLPELVTTNLEDYERLILDLAKDRTKLDRVKAKLAQNRTFSPLFDTAGYVRHLEQGLEVAHARFLQGLEPADIAIAAAQ